ncbi:MAG: dipeptide epimerase, partial [Halobacteriaceae archaeon]
IIVKIEDEGGTVGIGGAAPSTYYGETIDTVEAVLPSLLQAVERIDDINNLGKIEQNLYTTVRDNPAARCAVSIACHDLVAKRLGLPLYRYWGLDPDESIHTSYTIGIDDIETVKEKAENAISRGHSILKVKVGTDNDEEILQAIRDVAPNIRLRVDANEAWQPHEAVAQINALQAYDIEFVEQPVPGDDLAGLQYVYEHSPLPIAADESCVTAQDIPKIADRVDIANLKLMKCGGIREAFRMIHTARAHNLEVMCGCMVESNASIAAAAHLSPLLDYADLDGSLLLEDDPYTGVPFDDGYIDLNHVDRPGTAATYNE